MSEAVTMPSLMMMISTVSKESLARDTHTHTHTHRQADTHRQTERQTDRQAGRQADKHRQTDSQAGRQTFASSILNFFKVISNFENN